MSKQFILDPIVHLHCWWSMLRMLDGGILFLLMTKMYTLFYAFYQIIHYQIIHYLILLAHSMLQ